MLTSQAGNTSSGRGGRAPRVLFTTVYRPLPATARGEHLFDPYESRFTKHQGVFTFEGHVPYMASHLIAKNIEARSVVLEFPSLDELAEELTRGYDYVGIGFQNLYVERVFEIARLVRERAPQAQIVLGGYGVHCVDAYVTEQPEAAGLFDHVCREEGITFFRRLLGQAVDAPLDLVAPVNYLYPFRMRPMKIPVGVVLAGLGCTRRCEFCNTAALHQGHHRLADGRAIYETAKRYARREPRLRHVTIFDEDLLAHGETFAELSRHMQADHELLSRISLSLITSVASLSRLDATELVRSGVGSVWLGVESHFSGLEKLRGRGVADLFAELHAHGITTTASFIIGLDCQSRKNVDEDVERLVRMVPTFSQVACLSPGPGTPLWQRLEHEGRLRFQGWHAQHMYAENLAFRGFAPGEVLSWVERAQRRLFERHGSSSLRAARVWLNGLRLCRDSGDPALRARGRLYLESCRTAQATLLAQQLYAPTEEVRATAAALAAEYRAALGPPGAVPRAMSLGLVAWLARNRLLEQVGWFRDRQPPSGRTVYARA